ncbi:MAG: hypothetical protein JZU47_10835 [Prolixibacteraceae bacterium]|nr:hypothetical protein [Prolixibacteraceae bacterium]
MNKQQELEREVYELIGDANAENSIITVKALEAACLILDNKFGRDFSKNHPDLAVSMTETLMKNIRLSDQRSIIRNGIGEYLDALRIVILQKDIAITGNLSLDIPDAIKIDN